MSASTLEAVVLQHSLGLPKINGVGNFSLILSSRSLRGPCTKFVRHEWGVIRVVPLVDIAKRRGPGCVVRQ